MKSRHEVDPELHVLRSAALSTRGRTRQQLESARFNLYAAFESQNADEARRWARALRAAILVIDEGDTGPSSADVSRIALGALDTIEAAL